MRRAPRADDAARLYVLIYDSTLFGDALGAPPSGLIPKVFWSYPAAIFVDLAWVRAGAAGIPNVEAEDLLGPVLVHEAGHALGLTRSRAHGDGAHCAVDGCIMQAAIELSFTRFLLGGEMPAPQLCAPCAADLWAVGSDGNVRFLGAALVRREPLYAAVTLPGLTFVSFIDPGAIDAARTVAVADGVVERSLRDLPAPIRADARGQWSPVQVSGYVAADLDAPGAAARLRPAIEAALADPDPHVVEGARRLEAALESRKSHLTGGQRPREN